MARLSAVIAVKGPPAPNHRMGQNYKQSFVGRKTSKGRRACDSTRLVA